MMRGRMLAIAVVVVGLVIGGVVLTVGSVPSSCAYPDPIPNLPAVLRAQGGFDQSINGSDVTTIDQLSQTAATSLHTDLIGVKPGALVLVRSIDRLHPDAEIVPLIAAVPAGAPAIAGLAVFLTDCSGGLHYSTVADLGTSRIGSFPAVSAAAARDQLASDVQLVYASDPTRPVWRTGGGGQTLAAG